MKESLSILMEATQKKSWLINGWKFILAFALIWFVVSQTDAAQIWSVLQSISLPWLVVYFVFFILATLVKALQYQIALGKGVDFASVLNVVVVQNLASNFLAAGAGVASYITLLKAEHSVKVSRATIAFLLTKFGDILMISMLLAVSLGRVWERVVGLQWLSIVLLVGMGVGILVFLSIVLFRSRFSLLLRQLATLLRVAHFSMTKKGLEFVDVLAQQETGAVLHTLRGICAGSFLYLVVTLFWLYAGLRVFHIQLDVWELAYSSSLYYLITYVPIQVLGGLGVTDMSMMYVYSLFGPTQTEMAATMLGLRLLVYLMNIALLVYLPLYAVWYKPSHSSDT